MLVRTLAFGLVGAVLASVMAAAPTSAAGNTVTAVSRHGNGTVTGAVREGSRGGLEVQLPSGRWTACRTRCSETLRVESIDYWESTNGGLVGAGAVQNECGIFGCLEIGF